ncbi:MAG: haloacid dehalogenase-like hydrolase [Clostridiales Family XIII bacterium]|jgi:phosphoglycolate phosphatase-like HAD superfamily hydrolase|nr:haloacid dehalogenase-like hydrolase [Clostridiales Family XIII bacterium]
MFVFWDIDGTLMSCGSDGTKALNKTFFELHGTENAFLRAGIGNALDFAILHRIAAECGIEDFDINAFAPAYVSNLERILAENGDKRVLPGVVALLEYVRGRAGWESLLLTSNLRAGAEAKLRSVGLWSYFADSPCGGFGDAPGEKWDAAPAAIAELAARSGRSPAPRDCILIGDGVYDIRCAKRIGARHIAVATGWTPAEILAAESPEYLFADLADTARVVAAMNGASGAGSRCADGEAVP